MTVIALSSPSVQLPVDGVWRLSVAVAGPDGWVADPPVITVTDPSGTAAVVVAESLSTGIYRAAVIVTAPGRYVARAVTAASGAVDFTAYATGVVPAAGMPDLDACKTYLDVDLDDTSRDAEIQDALTAESSAQRDRCRVPAAYPASLREALLRRVARNLALRMLPLAVLRGDGEAGDTVLYGGDPEIKRLEAPHRKRVMG